MSIWLEITTTIKCPNICQYCPNDQFVETYNSNILQLSFSNFKLVIDKIPDNSIICFSGFAEPATNKNLSDMIIYAHSKNHKVLLLTTLMGWSIDEYDKVKDILTSLNIHLPDNNKKTIININKSYLDLLIHIILNPPKSLMFNHHDGDIHDDIQHIIPNSTLLNIHDRSGLINEGIKTNVVNANYCKHAFLFYYEDGAGVLLPDGRVVSCCNDFRLQNIWGNLFEQSWDDIKANIHATDLCKKCICGSYKESLEGNQR